MVIMTILMKIVGDGSPRGGAGLNPHELLFLTNRLR